MLTFEDFELDEERRELRRGGRVVDLDLKTDTPRFCSAPVSAGTSSGLELDEDAELSSDGGL